MKPLTPDNLCRYLSGDARTMTGMLLHFGEGADLPRLVKLGREAGAIVTFTPHGLGAVPRYEAVEGATFTDPERQEDIRILQPGVPIGGQFAFPALARLVFGKELERCQTQTV